MTDIQKLRRFTELPVTLYRLQDGSKTVIRSKIFQM